MNYFKPMLSSVLVVLSLSACADRASDLEGKWVIDLEATLQNMGKLGTPPGAIEDMRKSFEGGRLYITPQEVKLSVAGRPEQVSLPYKYVGQASSCFNLEIKSQVHSYCVSNGSLEVHDPTTKLVVVYSRK
jgi:hypothetical protein